MMDLFHYTNHPFIDVGVATITAFVGKRRPEEVVLSDLEAVAEYLKDIYCNVKEVQNQLNTVFQGAHFTQPAMKPEQKRLYADKVLFAFRADRPVLPDTYCTFFPEKLALVEYAHRQYFPLLNGIGLGNFSALGRPGIPVSGVALLAIHVLPLGCLKCGNLLAFHHLRGFGETTRDMTLVLTKQALDENRRAIQMLTLDSDRKMPNASYVRTRYIEAILHASQAAGQRRVKLENITGYHFTNFADKADLTIVRLDNTILDFVDNARQDAARAWGLVVRAGWQRPKGEENTELTDDKTRSWRNTTYEMLFDLPSRARSFIQRLATGNDWLLIEMFLWKVMLMEKARIDTYRQLGDRLAEYMKQHEGDSLGFYYKFSRAKDYGKLRSTIKSAAERILKAGDHTPLFTYDQFVLAFEHPSDGYRQWKLARDLISIRMLEVLQQRGVDISTAPDGMGNDEEDSDEE